MCDHSGIEEHLDRYRRNNVELAEALNELKIELNIVQTQLLDRNRELQKVYVENATLKSTLAQKESQISTWRAILMDLVTSNTRKYTEVMQKIGLVPAAKEPIQSNESPVLRTENTISTAATQPADQISRVNLLRRQKENDVSPSGLANLTEESIHSQFNESKNSMPSPEKSVSHVTSRRRISVPTSSPPKPLRESQKSLNSNGETKGKKSGGKLPRLDKIIDENSPTESVVPGRPSRKTAPKNLSEPKLGTKLRRN